jgi:hypothetical protein
MFPVFRADAAPRAVVMFTSGQAHGEAMGTFEGEPLYHASPDSAEHRASLDENGFAVDAHAVEDWTCGRHTIWLAQLRSAARHRSGRPAANPERPRLPSNELRLKIRAVRGRRSAIEDAI